LTLTAAPSTSEDGRDGPVAAHKDDSMSMAETPLRHPEKAGNPDRPSPRKPDWMRVKAPMSAEYNETRKLMRDLKLNTVCEEAACPNIGECWKQKHATVMILGEHLHARLRLLQRRDRQAGQAHPHEPEHVGQAVRLWASAMSCDLGRPRRSGRWRGGAFRPHHRIDPPPCARYHDRGADARFPAQAGRDRGRRRRGRTCSTTIWKPCRGSTHGPAGCPLFPLAAPADRVKQVDPSIFTKSGIMVGLGEEREEVLQVMDDLRSADVDFLTIGQYLQPTPKHHPIDRFVTPDEFDSYRKMAFGKGFLMVSASPLTRSSYHADSDFVRLRDARGGCIIDFYVDFEFKSKILQSVIEVFFSEAVRRMVGAFEARARKLYGPGIEGVEPRMLPRAPA
jgi:lipoic acid synthetase